MVKKEHEIMNVSEVAEMLRCANITVYLLVRKEGLPAKHVGRCLRFFRSDVINWLRQTD